MAVLTNKPKNLLTTYIFKKEKFLSFTQQSTFKVSSSLVKKWYFFTKIVLTYREKKMFQ